jgi:hypothetical protein
MKKLILGMLGSIGVLGLAGCSGSTATAPEDMALSDLATSGAPAHDDAGSNARSPPAEGGAFGTIDSVSTPSFTMTTAAGQKVTIDETSSTTYLNGTSATTADAIVSGGNVLVLGIVSSTTITASQITLEPDDGGGAAASAAAGVVPFQPGAPSVSKSVGQIPADYTEGAGTIVGGAEADQATEAALTTYPGVLVDRVALLGSGAYNVHCIGVNWPHHIFVDQNVSVVGAN